MNRIREEFPRLVEPLERLITSGLADRMIKNAGIRTVDSYGNEIKTEKQNRLNSQKGFKEVELYLLKKHALKMIRPFMVVQAVIFDKACDGVVMLIKSVFQRDSNDVFIENLDKLKIYATCQTSELEEGCGDPNVGDVVKAAILKVDLHTDEVFVTMRNDQKRVHLLGVCGSEQNQSRHLIKPSMGLTSMPSDAFDPANEMDGSSTPSYGGLVSPAYTTSTAYSPAYNPSPYYGGAHNAHNAGPSDQFYPYAPSPSYNNHPSPQALEQRGRAWREKVHAHPLYRNPHGHNLMIHAFNIRQYASCLGPALKKYDPKDNYKTLRANQNKAFARKSLEKGVAFAKTGATDNAVKCYDHALEIDPEFTDALVAKGALLAKSPTKNYDEAINLLERALKIDPLTENALEYLQKVMALQEDRTEMPPPETESLLKKVDTRMLKTLLNMI